MASDHIHVLAGYRPHVDVSLIVRWLKGISSRIILQEYSHLRRLVWRLHFWARGHLAVSTANLTDEIVQKYNAAQEGELGHDRSRLVIDNSRKLPRHPPPTPENPHIPLMHPRRILFLTRPSRGRRMHSQTSSASHYSCNVLARRRQVERNRTLLAPAGRLAVALAVALTLLVAGASWNPQLLSFGHAKADPRAPQVSAPRLLGPYLGPASASYSPVLRRQRLNPGPGSQRVFQDVIANWMRDGMIIVTWTEDPIRAAASPHAYTFQPRAEQGTYTALDTDPEAPDAPDAACPGYKAIKQKVIDGPTNQLLLKVDSVLNWRYAPNQVPAIKLCKAKAWTTIKDPLFSNYYWQQGTEPDVPMSTVTLSYVARFVELKKWNDVVKSNVYLSAQIMGKSDYTSVPTFTYGYAAGDGATRIVVINVGG